MCVHVSVHILLYEGVWTHVPKKEEFNSQQQVSSSTTQPIFLIHGLSLILAHFTYSARLTGQRALGIFLTLPP